MNRSATPSVEEVRTRFDQWRQTREGRTPIPDELWSMAVEVARRDGVNRTAAVLHLDGGKLKRMMGTSNAVDNRRESPTFIELMASGASGLAEYTLEVESGKAKLRIHCKGATLAELAELSRVLWDVGR